MGYLFWRLSDHHPPPNRRTPQTKQSLKIEKADTSVLADFLTLQSVWRRQGTLRRTEERQVWKHLIWYLGTLPPPPD